MAIQTSIPWVQSALTLLLLATGACVAAADPLYSIAICAIVRDEHAHMLDWVDYHEALGFDKFYIFDDNSTQPMGHLLKQHIDSGLVDYTFKSNLLAESNFPLMHVFNICLRTHGVHHRWMAFIDPDEYLHIKKGSVPYPGGGTIGDFMRGFEDVGGVVVNWRLFGSSGILSKPSSHPLQTYLMCTDSNEAQNRHVKSIVFPAATIQALTPHHFEYAEGVFAVNEAHETVLGPLSDKIATDRIVLLHFVVQSREDFEEKMVRTRPSNGMNLGHKELPYFEHMDAISTQNCTEGIDALAHSVKLRRTVRGQTVDHGTV